MVVCVAFEAIELVRRIFWPDSQPFDSIDRYVHLRPSFCQTILGRSQIGIFTLSFRQ